MAQTIKHAIIVCHPSESSFTLSAAHRYADAVRAHGQEVVLRDLYREGFDPVLREEERHGHPAQDVRQEWAMLGKPDAFVLVYPIWFGTPPALLKGYIDRVFGAGRALGQETEGADGELLAGRHLVSLTSSGSHRAWLDEKGVLGSLRTVYDRYLSEVFGFTEAHRYHFDGISDDLPEQEVRIRLNQAEKAAREVMARMHPAWQAGDPNRR